MKHTFIILFLFLSVNLFSQSKIAETLKFKVIIEEEVLPGAIIKIKDATYETITDINGEGKLLIPYDKTKIVITFLGSQAEFKIIHPADFILVDLNKKRASIFNKDKLIDVVDFTEAQNY